MRKLFERHGNVAISLLLAFMLSSISYYSGVEAGLAAPRKIVIENVEKNDPPPEVRADFSVFWQAWSKLKDKHINGEKATSRQFLEGAIKGLAGSLDDPHTTYFNVSDSKKFTDDVRGNFGGIGAEIGSKEDQIIVIAPLKGSPSEKAGLKPKDRILEIDSKSTSNLTVDEAVKLIRGEIGTKVVLTVFREGWKKTEKIEITRQVIQIPTVDSKIIDGKLIHLNLYAFNENSDTLFAEAIAEGLAKGGKGLILDLRNNPGGYLDVAVSLAGWFLNSGDVVVKERFASGNENLMKANGNEKLKNFPVVILLNGGSASASEILAGALKANRSIKIVGEKSFGKGTVQELNSLQDGSTLKITIANWLTPDGKVIEKNGIEPDYKVEFTEEDIKKEFDSQLEKAKEILKAEIAK